MVSLIQKIPRSAIALYITFHECYNTAVMSTLTVITESGRLSIETVPGKTFFELINSCLPGRVYSPCGGHGTCGKCKIKVTGHVRNTDTDSVSYVEDENVLSCRFEPLGDVTAVLPVKTSMVIEANASDITPQEREGLGLAVDIGTTTAAAFLYDLKSGKLLAQRSGRNAQRIYGGDVISRIQHAGSGKLSELQTLIRNQIDTMAAEMLSETGHDSIEETVFSGNTVMQHLAAGLSPESIGVAPFTPLSLFGDYTDGVYYSPCISGYVGGDITAGLMSVGANEAEGLMLYIDIGTNGEIALGNKEGFVTCACAAGPALEGAELSCGSEAIAGAIDKVYAEDGVLKIHTINGETPKSICGSGIIDAIAACLELGLISDTGKIVNSDKRIVLSGGVYITQEDVSKIQYAKGAIRAGIDTLLSKNGKKPSDLTSFVIAGGFGSFINVESAIRIGMIPDIERSRITSVGNASGRGSSMALAKEKRDILREIAVKCSYIELSTDPEFSDTFIDSLFF